MPNKPTSFPRIFAGTLLLIVFLLWQAPATLMSYVVNLGCDRYCALTQVTGSFWQGSGRMLWRDDLGIWHDAANLSWAYEWRQWQQLDVLLGINNQQARISLNSDAVNFSVPRIRVPVVMLVQLLPSALPRQGWFGDLRIEAQGSCSWQGDCKTQAKADWRNAGMMVISSQPLGDYRLQLQQTDAATATINWNSDRGPLRIDLRGQVKDGNLTASGQIWAEGSEHERERLENYLRPLGKQDNNGRFNLRYPLKNI